MLLFPLFVKDAPLAIVAQGTFFPPGIYVNVYDSLSSPTYILKLDDAAEKRIASKLSSDDRQAIKDWLMGYGIPESEIDIAHTEQLIDQWVNNYAPEKKIPGMTNAKRNYYIRLNNSLKGILSKEGSTIAAQNADTCTLEAAGTV